MKSVLGVIAGLIAAGIVIMLVQQVSISMYPMPEGLAMDDQDGFAAYIASLPMAAFFIVILGYVLGSFVGGFVAAFFSKSKLYPALIVGGVLTVAGVFNALKVPEPMWVSIVSLMVFIPLAHMGSRLVKTA